METQTVSDLRDQWTTISIVTAWLIVDFIGGYRYRDHGFRNIWQEAFYPTAVVRRWWKTGSLKRRLLWLPVLAGWLIGQTVPWILTLWMVSLLLLTLTLYAFEFGNFVHRDELYRTLILIIGFAFIVHVACLLSALFTKE